MNLIKRTATLLLICCFLFSNMELVSSGIIDVLGNIFCRCFKGNEHSQPPSSPTSHTTRYFTKVEIDEGTSQSNIVVGVFSTQGRRPHMQDRYFSETNIDGTGLSLFAVFDGHGGEDTAEQALSMLMNPMKSQILLSKKSIEDSDIVSGNVDEKINYKQILKTNIDNFETYYLKRANENLAYMWTGTTAIIALIDEKKLFVANVGDSRGVMCDNNRNTVPLSSDHKPTDEGEKKRIEDAGGVIYYKNGIAYIDGLAMTRSLGDEQRKTFNRIIATPDIKSFDLSNPKPTFLIFASDGLWDRFTNQEAVDFVLELLNEGNYDVQNIAERIVNEAYSRGSKDNITVIVVVFP